MPIGEEKNEGGVTMNQVSWLLPKIEELLHYKYDPEFIYAALKKADLGKYRYLTAMMYKKSEEIVEEELLNLSPTQE